MGRLICLLRMYVAISLNELTQLLICVESKWFAN